MKRPHLITVTARGHTYHYVRKTWMEGGKQHQRQWRITAEPDTPEFDAQYWRLRAGMDDRQAEPSGKTWGDLIRSYRLTAKYRGLKPQTKRSYERHMARLLAKNATKEVRSVTRQQIRAIHEAMAETPGEADRMLAVLSILLDFAVIELEWLDKNPAKRIQKFGPQSRVTAWPESALRAFENGCISLGEDAALTAFHLGVGIGQRIGDVLAMEWSQYDGTHIRLTQGKTGVNLDLLATRRLKAHLDALPRTGRHILAKNVTQPLSYSQVHKAVMRVRKATGLTHLRIHGWRATAAVELRMAGVSLEDIATVTGHADLDMVRHYTADYDRKEIAARAQKRRD